MNLLSLCKIQYVKAWVIHRRGKQKSDFYNINASSCDMLIHRPDSNKLRTAEGTDMDDLEEQLSLYEAIIDVNFEYWITENELDVDKEDFD